MKIRLTVHHQAGIDYRSITPVHITDTGVRNPDHPPPTTHVTREPLLPANHYTPRKAAG